MTRTDIHSPKNLNTSNYEYVTSMDLDEKPPMVAISPCPGMVYFTVDPVAFPLWQEGRKRLYNLFEGSPEHVHDTGQCDHCGAHLRYVAILRYKPSGKCLTVGEICLENRFSRATADFQAMRKQAELDREKHRIATARKQFAEDYPDLTFLATGEIPEDISWNNFIVDLSYKLRKYGALSEKQIEAARKALSKAAESNAKHAENEARKAAEKANASPVITGKVEITGTVRSLREPDEYSQFPSWKMLVEDDRGFKVWGSVPKALTVETDANGMPHYLAYDSLKGCRVKFVANVEAARPRENEEPDVSFGYFSRPRLAERIEE